MSNDILRQIQAALVATDPQDVETVQLLKEQYERARKASAAAQPVAKPPEEAAGAASRGGSAGGSFPTPRTAAAVVGMAPAKALGGLMDLGSAGATWLGKKAGLDLGEPYSYSGAVDRFTDELAGRPVPQSIGRSLVEGGVSAPLTGAANVPTVVAGAVGGGVSEALREGGASPGWQLAGAVASGYGAGKLAGKLALRPNEMRAEANLRRAVEGLTPDDLRTGARNTRTAQGEGIHLLPSQSLETEAPGLLRLQSELYNSRAGKADDFRTWVAGQPKRARDLVEGLRTRGGQMPREDDDLAMALREHSRGISKEAGDAVNTATRGLYNDPLTTGWKFNPALAGQVEAGIRRAALDYRGQPHILRALRDAGEAVTGLLRRPDVTPGELNDVLAYVKDNLPMPNDMAPATVNRVRGVVKEVFRPLDELVAQHAPPLAEAKRVQSELRQVLPNTFSDVVRQGKAGGGASAAVDSAMGKPSLVAALRQRDPQLAQELLQRHLERVLDDALSLDSTSGLPKRNAGVAVLKGTTEGAKGATFDKELVGLFRNAPDPAAAAEGFRRVAKVAAMASRPDGVHGGAAGGTNAVTEAVRGGIGTFPQQVNVFGRAAGALFGRLSHNATIDVISRPDVMERLIYISTLPTPRLTPAAVLGAVPQLFQGDPNEP